MCEGHANSNTTQLIFCCYRVKVKNKQILNNDDSMLEICLVRIVFFPNPFPLKSIPTWVNPSSIRLPFGSEYRWASGISMHCLGFVLPPSGPFPGPLVIKSLRTRAPIKDHCSGCSLKRNCSEGRETPVLCSYELKITAVLRLPFTPSRFLLLDLLTL